MSEQLTAAEKEKLIENVKHEIALANLTEILKAMTEKCFRKCIGKPGSSLDSSESKCLSMCTDRYMDAWNLVSRAYGNRILREGGGGGGPTFS